MKALKLYLIMFILHVYTEYIGDFDDTLTKTGSFFLKPAWFVRAIFTYSLSIVLFPLVSTHMMEKEIIDDLKNLFN